MFAIARTAVVTATALATLGAGTAAWAATTSTSLSNGTLSMEVLNGRHVSGNSSLFYSSVSYKKTGGSTVNAVFVIDAGSALYNSPTYSIAAGTTKSYSFGGKPVPSGCRVVGGMNAGGYYWTPALNPC